MAGKTYNLVTVFGYGIFSRGAVKTSLIVAGAAVVGVFWVYSASLYFGVIGFPWPFPAWFGGTSWMLNSGLPLGITRSARTDVLAVGVFATYPLWFYIGTELGLAGHRVFKSQRIRERNRIIRELAEVMYQKGGAIPPGAGDVNAAGSVESLLREIPPLYLDTVTGLLFAFDSRFFVLAFTGKWRRFVDLDSRGSDWEKLNYLEVWESNALLYNVARIFKIMVAYGYFTKPEVYAPFYNGPMTPNLPPWYNPGPTAEPVP